jgi:hypothetical protein
MAFNFSGFLAGASEQIVKSIEEKEEEIREEERLKAEREFQREMMERRASLSAGAAAASERRRRNQDIEDLTSRAAFIYGKDNAAVMATQGLGYLTEAVTLGNQLNAAGYDAKTFYTAGGNTLDTAKRVEKNIKTTDATIAAIPTADAPSAPAPVAGFDFAGIREALKSSNRVANSNAQLLAFNTQDLVDATLRGDTDALEKSLNAQTVILNTIAATEDPEAIQQISEDPRLLFNNMRAQAIGDRGKEVGDFGELKEEIEGAPYFGALMNYDAGNRMLTYISEFDLEQVSNVTNVANAQIKSAEIELMDYAMDVAQEFMANPDGEFAKGKVSTGGVVAGQDNIRYGKYAQLPSLEKTGNLLNQTIKKPTDAGVVILQDEQNNIRVAIYTGIPNPKLGGAPYLVSDY